MLNLLDKIIFKLLDTDWTPPPTKPDFSFNIPNEDWDKKVKNEQKLFINIYLYEVSENRNFHRASWDNVPLADGSVVLSQPPAYIDCHYLVSAWSGIKEGEMVSPVQDEHQALSETLRILLRNPDVVPAALAIPGGGQVFQNAHIYLTVASPEPPRVLNDFWNTMKLPWRPALMLVVTAPLDLLVDSPPSPVVTTLIERFTQIGSTTVEELITIGGLVLKAADDKPVNEATVQRLDSEEISRTDSQGRYVLTGIPPGLHKFRASATGFTPVEKDINIPADSPAKYIFKLTP